MNRQIALLAAAAVIAPLAACVPSTYGYGQNGGYGQNDGYGQNQGYDPRYGDAYGNGYPSQSQFRCESEDHRVRRCNVDTRGGVRLVRQESDAPCVQGRSWGYDRDGVWVSGGCRGSFALGDGGYAYGNGQPVYGNDQSQVFRCESEDERRNACRLPDRARSVTIRRQLSDTRCQQGYNWGWTGETVWVDRGCRAEFVASY